MSFAVTFDPLHPCRIALLIKKYNYHFLFFLYKKKVQTPNFWTLGLLHDNMKPDSQWNLIGPALPSCILNIKYIVIGFQHWHKNDTSLETGHFAPEYDTGSDCVLVLVGHLCWTLLSRDSVCVCVSAPG